MKKALIIASVYGFIHHFERNDIKILQELGYEIIVASNFDNYKNELDNLNISLIHIPFQRSPFSLKNIIAYKKLNEFLKKEKIDLIHCHTPIGGVVGRIAGYKNKVKNIIYTAHGFHFFKGASLINWLLFYPVEKYLSKYTNILITINQEDYKRAQNFYAEKVEYIPGVGLDTERIRNTEVDKKKKREELGLTEDNIVLLSVGELSKRKNHITPIKALAQIKDNKNIFYLIAGVGPLEKYLKEECKRLGIENQVKFLGFRKDVYELCKVSDIFVFPSLQEGLPVALMEALCCDLPIICSDIRGNRDLIENKKNGFLIKNNVEEYINKINFLLKDKFYEKLEVNNSEIIKKIDIKNIREKMRGFFSKNEKDRNIDGNI